MSSHSKRINFYVLYLICHEYHPRPPVHGLRHPQIFYYGHTPCLYVNKLRVAGVLDKPVNAYFESIFEVGVDEMLWDDMHKNDMVWPTVREVHEYRKDVYDTVLNTIMRHPSLDDTNGPVVVNQEHPMWALFMGFEHERIHLETSSVLFAETPVELVQMPENWPKLHPSVAVGKNTRPLEGVDYPSNAMIPVKGDTVRLGKPVSSNCATNRTRQKYKICILTFIFSWTFHLMAGTMSTVNAQWTYPTFRHRSI